MGHPLSKTRKKDDIQKFLQNKSYKTVPSYEQIIKEIIKKQRSYYLHIIADHPLFNFTETDLEIWNLITKLQITVIKDGVIKFKDWSKNLELFIEDTIYCYAVIQCDLNITLSDKLRNLFDLIRISLFERKINNIIKLIEKSFIESKNDLLDICYDIEDKNELKLIKMMQKLDFDIFLNPEFYRNDLLLLRLNEIYKTNNNNNNINIYIKMHPEQIPCNDNCFKTAVNCIHPLFFQIIFLENKD